MKLYFISPLLIQKMIWIPSHFGLKYLTHWNVTGLENLRVIKGPVIFACNHTSELDPFFIPASLSFFSRFSPIFYTSREKSFYNNSGWRKIFYGGLFFKILGSYPVSVGLNDYEKSMAHHIEIIRDGGSLCIFPEGRITPDGTIQPAKGGIAFLAYKTGASVIPVHFKDTFRISLNDLILRRRHISISYGMPVDIKNQLTGSPSVDDFKKSASIIMDEVKKLQNK